MTKDTRVKKPNSNYDKTKEQYERSLRREAIKQEYKNKLFSLKQPTYTKSLVSCIIIVSLLDLQITYILAFLGRVQIAETLSINISNTIIAVAFTYMLRAFFDTFAEQREERLKTQGINTRKYFKELKQAVKQKTCDVLNSGGFNINLDDDDDDDECINNE